METRLININQLNKLSAGLMDIQVSRHPLASEITIVYNDVMYDIYRDSIPTEDSRVNKLAIVKTDVDAQYVQQVFFDDYLWDDMDKRVPYQVIMTLTGLKRKPRMDDKIIYKDMEFVVSKVKPLNEKIDSVINVLMYPNREMDEVCRSFFEVHAVFLYDTNLVEVDSIMPYLGCELIMDIVYDGNPKRYSFDGENWEELTMNRIKFLVTDMEMTLYLSDGENISTYNFSKSS